MSSITHLHQRNEITQLSKKDRIKNCLEEKKFF